MTDDEKAQAIAAAFKPLASMKRVLRWDGWESNETAAQRDEAALAYLELFGPDTYGLFIPHDLALYMEQRGWIEWQPPKFGTTLYQITAAGARLVGASAPEPRPTDEGPGPHGIFTMEEYDRESKP